MEISKTIKNDLDDLISENLAYNLYGNGNLWGWSKKDFEQWDEIGLGYRNYLYGMSFDIQNKKDFSSNLFKFFNKHLAEGYQSSMFREGWHHHPVIGIYNLIDNQLIGFGLGRKNRLFTVTSGRSIDKRNLAESFCKLDHGKVVEKLQSTLDEIGEYHKMGIEEGKRWAFHRCDKRIAIIRKAIPSFPDYVGAAISPGDF